MKRYLIGQIACFGDCLLATTLAKQLKQDDPTNHITWAVAAKYRSVLNGNPYIDDIWELPIYTRNITATDWNNFISQAQFKKEQGQFDELLITQIFDSYVDIFYTTLRHTVFNIFGRPITVDISPVIELTEKEKQNVADFARQNNLSTYRHVVLFECAPTSDQSKLNVPFALQIAQTITSQHPDICFIVTTSDKLAAENKQIIDASVLSFRENAELTKYCTLLIGCSSGITWLATSDYCKKLPSLQLLNEESAIFAGVNFDFHIHGLDSSHVIEMTDYDLNHVVTVIKSLMQNGVADSRALYNQPYKPNRYSLEALAKLLVWKKRSTSDVWKFMKNYLAANKKLGNTIKISQPAFYLKLLYWNLQRTGGIYYQNLKKPLRMALSKNSK